MLSAARRLQMIRRAWTGKGEAEACDFTLDRILQIELGCHHMTKKHIMTFSGAVEAWRLGTSDWPK
jgi:hypothetical protein